MKPTVIEDQIFEFETFEKDGSELMENCKSCII